MKTPDHLLPPLGQQGPQGLATALRDAETSHQQRQQERQHHDWVDAINQVFAEFEMAYHNQFHRAYADEGSLTLAKKYWLGNLSRFTPELVKRATRDVVSSSQYLPSLATLVQACENGMHLFGLPEPHDAYVEACMAPHPKLEHDWSHPAVFLAGRATDWFVLETEPESRALPRFEHHYRQVCRRVFSGESLSLPAVEALPHDPPRPLPAEEQKERLAALRKKLSL